jgi:ribosomal protein S7
MLCGWLIEAAESNMQKDIGQALAHEIIDACNLKGVAYKKKLDLYKEVDASQLYLKYIH